MTDKSLAIKVLADLNQQRMDFFESLESIHGAPYANCVINASDLASHSATMQKMVCSQFPLEVIDATGTQMATALAETIANYVRLLFASDFSDAKKMDEHYKVFSGHVVRVVEALQRIGQAAADNFKH